MINRRDLFKGAAAVLAAVGVPVSAKGTHKHLPSVRIYSGLENTRFLTSDYISREFVRLLHVSDVEFCYIYDASHPSGKPHKVGDTVSVVPHFGKAILEHHNIHAACPSMDLMLSLDEFSDKWIKPCADIMIANMKGKRVACAEMQKTDPSQRSVFYRGIGVRYSPGANIYKDEHIMVFDMLYGIT